MKKEKSLHELEDEGRKKKADNDEAAEQQRVSQNFEKDQIAILSMSRLASALWLPTIFPLSIGLTGFILISTVVAHGFGRRLAGKGGHGVMYDPKVDHWLPWASLILTAVLAFYIVLRPIAKRLAQRDFQKELEWLKSLPFGVDGYLEKLGKNERYFEFKIYYQKQQVPSASLVDNVFTGLAGKKDGSAYRLGHFAPGLQGTISHRRDSGSDEFCIELKSLYYMNGYKCHKLFHKFSETVFLPLNNDYRIMKIIVS